MPEEIVTGLEAAAVVLVEAGLSTLASSLIRPKDASNQISYPLNDITRGGYLPVVLGRRVVGAQVGWVGDRASHAAPHAGGSEISPGPSTGNLYYEGGWHQLCHGPIRKLHRIWAGAKCIWANTLDFYGTDGTDGVADGTLFQLPTINAPRDADYFRIYSGRDPAVDDSYNPINAYLQEHAGLTSRYPGLAYVMWQRKALGGSPTWPLMKYEIEVHPSDVLASAVAP